MAYQQVTVSLGGKEIILGTGKLAKQAGGSVTVQCGDTMILVTATAASKAKENIDFLPLTVDFIEKTFAAGKIPGGFFKREGRPTEQATLISRFIDRPIRPLFPEGYYFETQVIATTLSIDPHVDPDTLAMIGASAALMISDIPLLKPIAGCRVGRINGQFVINASSSEMETSDIDMIVAATEDAVVMVEGGAQEASEKDMVDAILHAFKEMQPVIKAQKELQSLAGKAKRTLEVPAKNESIFKTVETASVELAKAMKLTVKQERYAKIDEIKTALKKQCEPEGSEPLDATAKLQFSEAFESLKSRIMREMILTDKVRIDGRDHRSIRPISCEVGLLPRAHGSGLFTRGETQALVVSTLGSSDDEQTIDSIMGEYSKSFMLHYNFPPFSVGEVKPLRTPGRREVGHGALAERALSRMMPSNEEFPYTVRIVSEVLESNGSSSMASVCGGTLSLLDAGVPLKAPVAGIAMGLIKEGDRVAILSDILGDEDHLGDMDFKICGTSKGITALQMDIKIDGVSQEILTAALDQALQGRLHILSKMNEVMSEPRQTMSQHAPKIFSMKVKKDKIKDVIGSGGKNIKGIIEATGVKIDIDDDGVVKIFSSDNNAIEQAQMMVKQLVAEPEVGMIYRNCLVRKIMEFGAFVEIMPKTDGLVHISQLAHRRIQKVTDVLKEGDRVDVKCIGLDENGKIKLSIKELLPNTES